MVDRVVAYRMLKLKEGASKDDIGKRYNVILKRFRTASEEELKAEFGDQTLEGITAAYNTLMGYDVIDPVIEAEENRKPNLFYKKIGIDEKKTKNFFYYHKVHIIVGIIAIIVFGYTLKGCLNRVEPDFNIAFIGKIYYSDTDVLKKNIINKFPGIKEIGIDGAMIVPDGSNAEQDYAMQMKAMVLLAAGDIDVYIMDKDNFEKYGKQGAFANLDGLAGSFGVSKSDARYISLKPEGKQSEHIYGLDITNSPILKQSNIAGDKNDKKIASISIRAKHPDKAQKLIELLSK